MTMSKALLIAATVAISQLMSSNARANDEAKCEVGKGYIAAEVSDQISDTFAAGMKAIGVTTIIRYYDWSQRETWLGKTLRSAELDLIRKHGLNVAVIFQHNSGSIHTFTDTKRPAKDADEALLLAKGMAQPKGSSIFFGVDGPDAAMDDILATIKVPEHDKHLKQYVESYITRYFSEVAPKIRAAGFKIGAYGSGLVCDVLGSRGLIDYCWLAMSTGWPNYTAYEASGRWALKQVKTSPSDECFGMKGKVSMNIAGRQAFDIGQWLSDK